MPRLIALHSFKHEGKSRARHSEWDASTEEAAALADAGLVRVIGKSKQATTRNPAPKKKAPPAKATPSTETPDALDA